MKPVVQLIAEERGLRTAFVNVDEEGDLGGRFDIRSIPALKLFKNGEVVAEMVGGRPKADLEAWLEANGV